MMGRHVLSKTSRLVLGFKAKIWVCALILNFLVQACSECVQKFFGQLNDFRHVMRFGTTDASVLVAKLFRNLSEINMHKLKCILNSLAKLFHIPVDTQI